MFDCPSAIDITLENGDENQMAPMIAQGFASGKANSLLGLYVAFAK